MVAAARKTAMLPKRKKEAILINAFPSAREDSLPLAALQNVFNDFE
jgi:hypothetical protein